MIRHKAQIPPVIREQFWGGEGSMASVPLLADDEFHGKGRVFAVNSLKPGHSIGVHTHKGDFEVYYILKGEGLYHDNGVDVRVKAGDVTYTWDGQCHGMINVGAEDLEMIALVLFTNA
ncbi:MAG: cupin domain-containing protein [Betaproteobacteria bacterium]|nr:cupin domain-containing protein [Betaproteobacteria bacterium]